MIDLENPTPQQARDLYMKYLGTLNVVCTCHLSLSRHPEAEEAREMIDNCVADAARYLKGRVTFRRILNRIDMEPV